MPFCDCRLQLRIVVAESPQGAGRAFHATRSLALPFVPTDNISIACLIESPRIFHVSDIAYDLETGKFLIQLIHAKELDRFETLADAQKHFGVEWCFSGTQDAKGASNA